MRDKYIVYSYEDDEPQVIVDIVAAESIDDAETRVQSARRFAVVDGGGLFSDELKSLRKAARKSLDEVEADWRVLCRELGANALEEQDA